MLFRSYGGAFFKNTKLCGANLQRVLLHCSIFTNSSLSSSNLTHAGIMMGSFHNCDFKDAILYNANLADGDFRRSNFSSTDFRKSNLSRTNLRESLFSNTDMRGSNISDADFHYLAPLFVVMTSPIYFTLLDLKSSFFQPSFCAIFVIVPSATSSLPSRLHHSMYACTSFALVMLVFLLRVWTV